MRILEKLLLTLCALALFSPPASAETPQTYSVPDNCDNNEGINADPQTFIVGPLYLRSCENVCVFDAEERVLDRKTVWHVPTVCGGPGGTIVQYFNCVEDKRARNCFKPEVVENDPRNHDCAKNSGGGWTCGYIDKEARCTYPDVEGGGARKAFVQTVRIAECRQLKKSP